jgi:hypothetical protein
MVGILITPLVICATDDIYLVKIPSMQELTKENYQPLSSENKKYWINATQYSIYSFSPRPQLGTIILKIEVFNQDNKKDLPYLFSMF